MISDTAGLTQFDAFVEELPPGSRSSHTHWHLSEDEMVLILSGTITLTEGETEIELNPGDAACWRSGDAVGHAMHNRSTEPVRYVVIGTPVSADRVTYPDLDRVLIYDLATNTRCYETQDGRPATKPV